MLEIVGWLVVGLQTIYHCDGHGYNPLFWPSSAALLRVAGDGDGDGQ